MSDPRFQPPRTAGHLHLDRLSSSLASLYEELPRLERWGRELAAALASGSRLLAAGNGGSAAQVRHLTSELVGRYRDDRPPFSAISLNEEACALTAIGNDYGLADVFARQVRAHGRPGDILVALSTSGSSPNVLAAVDAADAAGLTTWALTGRVGNPLALACDDSICVDSPHTATIQELHLACVHLLCTAFDESLERLGIGAAQTAGKSS